MLARCTQCMARLRVTVPADFTRGLCNEPQRNQRPTVKRAARQHPLVEQAKQAAKLRNPARPLTAIADAAMKQIDTLSVSELAMLLRSLALGRARHQPLLTATVEMLSRVGVPAPSYPILVWAFAKHHHHPGEVLTRHLPPPSALLSTPTPLLCQMMWAHAALSIPLSGPHLEAMETCVRERSDLNGIDIATLMSATVQLEERLSSPTTPHISHLLSALCERCVGVVHLLDARGVASVLWALTRARAAPPGLVSQLAVRLEDTLHSTGSDSLALSLWALSKLQYDTPAFWHTLSSHVTALSHTFTSRGISNTLWAYATHMSRTAGLSSEPLPTCPHEVALTTATHSIHPMLHALCNRALAIAAEFPPLGVSTTLWALGRLAYPHTRLYSRFAANIAAHVERYPGQTLALPLWALACAHTASVVTFPAPLRTAVMAQLRSPHAVRQCDPDALAGILHSLAKCHPLPESWLACAVGAILAPHRSHISPHTLAMVAVGCALSAPPSGSHRVTTPLDETAHPTLARLFRDSISPHFLASLQGKPSPDSRFISSVFWAFATARVRDVRVCEAACDAFRGAMRQTPPPSPQSHSNIAWAMSRLRYCDPPLLTDICRDVTQRAGLYSSQGMVSVVWAVACLPHGDLTRSPAVQECVACVCARLSPTLASLPIIDLSILAWSLAVRLASLPNPSTRASHHPEAATLTAAVRALVRRVGELELRGRVQLYQSALALQMVAGVAATAGAQAVMARVRDEVAALRPVRSSVQQEVEEALVAVVPAHHVEREFITEHGLSLDLAIPQMRIGIEVDGESHFFTDPSQAAVRSGAAALKTALLSETGWTVHHVGSGDWERVGPDWRRREELVARMVFGSEWQRSEPPQSIWREQG